MHRSVVRRRRTTARCRPDAPARDALSARVSRAPASRRACSSTSRPPAPASRAGGVAAPRRPASLRTADRARRCRTASAASRRSAPANARADNSIAVCDAAAREVRGDRARAARAIAARRTSRAPRRGSAPRCRPRRCRRSRRARARPRSRGARMLNSVSRSLSDVGRSPSHVGALQTASLRASPAMTRIDRRSRFDCRCGISHDRITIADLPNSDQPESLLPAVRPARSAPRPAAHRRAHATASRCAVLHAAA